MRFSFIVHNSKDLCASAFELQRMEPVEPVCDPVIETYKKDVDRTLLRENLKKTPLERLLALQAHFEFFHKVRNAVRRPRGQS